MKIKIVTTFFLLDIGHRGNAKAPPCRRPSPPAPAGGNESYSSIAVGVARHTDTAAPPPGGQRRTTPWSIDGGGATPPSHHNEHRQQKFTSIYDKWKKKETPAHAQAPTYPTHLWYCATTESFVGGLATNGKDISPPPPTPTTTNQRHDDPELTHTERVDEHPRIELHSSPPRRHHPLPRHDDKRTETMGRRSEEAKKAAAARKVTKESAAKAVRDQKALHAAERKKRAELKEKLNQPTETAPQPSLTALPPLPASPSRGGPTGDVIMASGDEAEEGERPPASGREQARRTQPKRAARVSLEGNMPAPKPMDNQEKPSNKVNTGDKGQKASAAAAATEGVIDADATTDGTIEGGEDEQGEDLPPPTKKSKTKKPQTDATAVKGTKAKKKDTNQKKPTTKRSREGASILKKPKAVLAKDNTKETPHEHKFKRVLFDLAVELTTEDRYDEMIAKVVWLLKTGRKVDEHLVMKPIDEKNLNGDLSSHLEVPNDFTDLGAYVEISRSGKRDPFELRRSREKDDEGMYKFTAPVVYFTLAMGMDIEPDKLTHRIDIEWMRQGGKRLAVNELGSFTTVTPGVFYRLWNNSNQKDLSAELATMMQTVYDEEESQDKLPDEFTFSTVPKTTWRRNVPKLPGQDTQQFDKWKYKQQQYRRTLHVECDKKDAPLVHYLCEGAKRMGLMEQMWGKQVHYSMICDEETSKADVKRLMREANHHINFHSSMTSDSLVGIYNLDGEGSIRHVVTRKVLKKMSLRQALYSFFKLKDGHSLFAEIHARGSGGADVVIPNTPEAEVMVGHMNKNIACFLKQYMLKLEVDEEFIDELLDQGVCSATIHEGASCSWDPETWEITTKEEKEREENFKSIEQAAWYNDIFAEAQGKNKNNADYAAPEALYNLDSGRSVKTLHERNEGTYAQGVDAFQLGAGKVKDVIDVEANSKSAGESIVSDMSGLSRGELIEQLRALRAQQQASAAKNDDDESSSESGDDEGAFQPSQPSDGSHSSMSSTGSG